MIKNYILTVDVLSPVFIGNGNEISKKDCLYQKSERLVYVMDSRKVFDGLKKAGMLKKYEEFLKDSKQKNFSDFTKNNNISLSHVKSWAAYTLPMNDITDVNNSRRNGGGSDNILEFVKDKFGCPYIPGSSMKGAVRTLIQNALCMKKVQSFADIRKEIESECFNNRTKYLSYAEKNISCSLFNTLNRKEDKPKDILNDSFAGIRISDSEPLDISSLILSQKIEVKPDGSITALPIKRECLRPGTKVRFSVEIDTDMMDISPEMICRYSKEVFEKYHVDFLDKFKDVIVKYHNCSSPVIIGGGSGYVSKTSTYSLYDDKREALNAVQKIMVNTTSTRKQHDPHKHIEDSKKYKVSPHIRKCTQYEGKLYDMGICEMSFSEV